MYRVDFPRRIKQTMTKGFLFNRCFAAVPNLSLLTFFAFLSFSLDRSLVIQQKYRITKRVGGGSFGDIYLGVGANGEKVRNTIDARRI